jgi:hypothetical protein
MKTLAFATASLVLLAGVTLVPQRSSWGFDDLPVGRMPPGFTFTDPQSAAWQVVREGAETVLAHTSQARAGTDLATVQGTSLGNVALSTRLRFPRGASAAGVAWRYRDAANYYAVALDLRAQNVRIYRVVAGNRTRLEDEGDLELDPAAWHTVKVEDTGSRMRVWLDGVPVADARDRSSPESGSVGVWTSADATVWFDNLQAEPAAEPRRGTRRD